MLLHRPDVSQDHITLSYGLSAGCWPPLSGKVLSLACQCVHKSAVQGLQELIPLYPFGSFCSAYLSITGNSRIFENIPPSPTHPALPSSQNVQEHSETLWNMLPDMLHKERTQTHKPPLGSSWNLILKPPPPSHPSSSSLPHTASLWLSTWSWIVLCK